MSNIIQFPAKKKEQDADKLHISYLSGKATGDQQPKSPEMFAERMSRIKASLEKISRIMSELKATTNPPEKK